MCSSAKDRPSHILVPAIHRNRREIRDIFLKKIEGINPDITDEPAELAEASRNRLREKFLSTKVAVSGVTSVSLKRHHDHRGI